MRVHTFPGDEVSCENERQKNAHVTAVDHHRQHGRVPAEHKLRGFTKNGLSIYRYLWTKLQSTSLVW